MSSSLVRWGGLAVVVAGVMYTGQAVVGLVAPQNELFASFSDYAIEAMFVVALLGTLAAIGGLHALQKESYGRLGMASFLLAFVGHALMLASAAVTLALAMSEALDPIFPLGFLAALVGLVLLGIATLRARVLPRLYGVLLIVGFPLLVARSVPTVGAYCWGSYGRWWATRCSRTGMNRPNNPHT